MAIQTINNGESGSVVRGKINDNFTEVSTLSVSSTTSTATLTPNGIYDAFALTAQAAGLTIANPSVDYANFDGFMLELTDNGVAKSIAWGTKYRAIGDALPTTTTAGKVMVITAIRSSPLDKYNVSWKNQP